jgi:hypothetical protein
MLGRGMQKAERLEQAAAAAAALRNRLRRESAA